MRFRMLYLKHKQLQGTVSFYLDVRCERACAILSDFPWQNRTVHYFYQGATGRDLFTQFQAVLGSAVHVIAEGPGRNMGTGVGSGGDARRHSI